MIDEPRSPDLLMIWPLTPVALLSLVSGEARTGHTADCGCKLGTDKEGVSFTYCPKHKAMPQTRPVDEESIKREMIANAVVQIESGDNDFIEVKPDPPDHEQLLTLEGRRRIVDVADVKLKSIAELLHVANSMANFDFSDGWPGRDLLDAQIAARQALARV